MGRDEIVAAGYGTPRQFLLNAVAELGDLEFQRATWLDPEMQNPHYSFVEFVESFYDYCGGDWHILDRSKANAPFRLQVQQGVITDAECDLFWKIHIALSNYNPSDQYDHAAILGDPDWQHVTALAALVVKQLKSQLNEPMDLAALQNELPDEFNKKWP